MKIILLGAPGAGKGTQADYICSALHIPRVSTGDMLRAAVKAGTELGHRAQKIMEQGRLVADEIILGLIAERIRESDCKGGFLLDGFPRTIPQAEGLDRLGVRIDLVIELAVDDEEIVRRMAGRWFHPGSGRSYHMKFNPPKIPRRDDVTGEELMQRGDDQEATVRERLRVYHEQTKPLAAYYTAQMTNATSDRVRYERISGSGSVDEIRDRISKVIAAES